MESVIAKLLQDFEQGKMNRRQLIQSSKQYLSCSRPTMRSSEKARVHIAARCLEVIELM